ncbi:MAG: TRAP transporter substrate-binding protein DctP [Proteobacteria bacterium]|nr:TRAP transporter substrate-binding protein DctP [Pseudomonadota bacterium]MBU1709445.1 TRAP transporter substrate-binding protein DctP [Pseudomonadota bacterium]
MTRLNKSLLIIFLTVAVICICVTAQARSKYLFKIASLAPVGSVWARQFDEFTNEVQQKTNGEVAFKVYPGGVMGNEQAVYRKMQVGQLHGGGFTMTGISEVVPDFRVMGVPFIFDSYEEVDWVKIKLMPHFKKAFEDKGLALIAMSEVGFVYAMSTTPLATLEDMRKNKTWLPEGDKVNPPYLETAGVKGTVLSIPDVLTSLQTGLVDTVFNSYYGAIVMQWFTRARYISDIPFSYAYGAFLLDGKQFSLLPAEYRNIIEVTAQKYFGILLAETRKSNDEALEVLKKNGVKLVAVDDESRKQLKSYRTPSVNQIIGRAFSETIYTETLNQLELYRAQAK